MGSPEIVLGTLGLRPEQALFVDDVQLNVDAAAAVGLVARRAVGPQGVREALRELDLDTEERT